MKKAILAIMLLITAAGSQAQQIYNGSFTQWSYFTNPDGWGTWASAVGQFNGTLGDSLARLAKRDTLPGNYTVDSAALKMVVDTITFPAQGQITLAGFVSLGGAFYNAPPDTPTGLIFGYYPYGKMPDSLLFDYKYIPAPGFNDSALVVMTMLRFDSVLQQELYYISTSWLLDTSAQWRHMALKLPYLDGDTFTLAPDSIQLLIFTSVASRLHRGTSLWIDTLHFDASVDIIDTFPAALQDPGRPTIKAYPNPANDYLHVHLPANETGDRIQLKDEDGRLVSDALTDKQDFLIDLRGQPAGAYFLSIISRDRLTFYRGKVAVLHEGRE